MKDFFYIWQTRLARLLHRKKYDDEMAEEMAFHLDRLKLSNIAAGMEPMDAEFAALKRFGGRARLVEECRDERGFLWLGRLLSDFRTAARSLKCSLGFSLTVVMTLAVGLGVAAKIFNLCDEPLFKGLPFPDVHRLVYIGSTEKDSPFEARRFGVQLKAYEERPDIFSLLAAIRHDETNVSVESTPLRAEVCSVSSGCFGTLGVKPVLGRAFVPEEFVPGKDRSVLISDHFRELHFPGNQAVLGRQIKIDSQFYTVVGILGVGQRLPIYFSSEIYRPLVASVDLNNVFGIQINLIGRLAPNLSLEQARAAIKAVKLSDGMPTWAAAFFAGQETVLMPIRGIERREIWWVLFAGGIILYTIALLNCANLMLVRVLSRRRELSIRLAVGAGGRDIFRLLSFECLWLTAAAFCLVALASHFLFPFLNLPETPAAGGAHWALRRSLLPDAVVWDSRAFIFLAALSFVTWLILVIIPAARAFQTNIQFGLKEGGRALGESKTSGRARNLLVLLQSALAVTLLSATGLMLQSFQRLHHVDLGFDPSGKTAVFVLHPSGITLKPDERLLLFQRLREQLATLPGVRSVAYGNDPLLPGNFWGTAQLQLPDGKFAPVMGTFVSKEFQQATGLNLISGRWLLGTPGQVEAVINETMAKTLFGNKDPIGHAFKIQVSQDLPYYIVGVVHDIREAVKEPAGMHFYVPDWMFPPAMSCLLIRTDHDPVPGFDDLVRKAASAIDPTLIVGGVQPLSGLVLNSMWQEWRAFSVLKVLSVIALLLAGVGLFSVIAYTVERRMAEFGIRLALGATSQSLFYNVLGRGMVIVGLGVGVGCFGAFALACLMSNMLFETKPYAPMVYLGIAALLLAVAGLAACVPALRATRADVVRLLRAE